MANNQKPERTEVKDLPVAEQEMTEQEMEKVQGGAAPINTSKSNIKNNPVGAPTPPPSSIAVDEPVVKVTG